jgi:hypothetical protein
MNSGGFDMDSLSIDQEFYFVRCALVGRPFRMGVHNA